MLRELSIRNLAVIEEVHLSFRNGFHVLTGETGAGKSIIIDALGLIAGGRGSSELVRYETDKAEIEAMFDLPADHPVWGAIEKLGIAFSNEEQLIIRREISASGKSSSRINGQMVNLTMLREIGEWLVNIHGQHEHQSLLNVDQHIHWLDEYAAEKIMPVKTKYQMIYQSFLQVQKELKELDLTSKKALQTIDLYRFQQEEISAAKLVPHEDESLWEEKRKLSNAEKMYQHTADAHEILYGRGKALDQINRVVTHMNEIAAYDRENLQALSEQIQGAYYQLEDAAYQLRDYLETIEFNSEKLNQIEQRLDVIATLRRKYGDSIADILQYWEQIQTELQQIEHKDQRMELLQKQLSQHERDLYEAAQRLSDERIQAAQHLADDIIKELRDLHMDRTQFSVRVDKLEQANDGAPKFTKDGSDDVEFLISANPGEPLRPLQRIASGGELSRIMLAMKAIFARIDHIPVLVFDEVDTGVSGRAAQAIAEKLSLLSRDCQVFSITHLPQVACMADSHYAIYKSIDGQRTFTQVTDLTAQERIQELARMLGGVEVTETTLQHAEEMLQLARIQKKNLQ
ncbi:MAG: DNA repair protein RecN [Paenibacillus sp. RIFOXYA1_FULL_44_5]|nr:MAG: DNA repair protein RecN [Paenibacillus sp. RIFOXYA1_FULL_44_5]